jgi:hypothetical protein
MAEYRIVTDNSLGFTVQVRRWWWPFWSMANVVNSHAKLEWAEAYARRLARPTVKYLGRL